MGRVYTLSPDKSKGQRSGKGYRFFTPTGEKIRHVYHVEFDADADEGMATLATFVCTQAGTVLVDYSADEACRVTFRTWVRAVPPGMPDPCANPEATLWRAADGSIAVNADPVPAVPFEVNHVG